MTAKPPTLPDLDGLVALARRGDIDIRPTLVRVLTDLYVQTPRHSAEEERHFSELALRLLDAVDITTRATVAATLAAYAGAPRDVLLRLARDDIAVAEPVLRRFSRPIPAGPGGGAGASDPRHAMAYPTAPPAGPPDAPAEMATETGETPGGVIDPDEAIALAGHFASADADERRRILLRLDSQSAPAARLEASLDAVIRQVETAALGRRISQLVHELGRALRISDAHADWIVSDPGGEPFIAAAKALRMPGNVLQRVLLFANPAIGHSVQRVFDLARLYEQTSEAAARRLVAIWQHVHPLEVPPVGSAPQRKPEGSGQRREIPAAAARRDPARPGGRAASPLTARR